MGTNYYAQINKCDHCGRSADRVHLGKSSGGWTFTVDISHGEFKDFDSLKRFLHSEEVSEIRNEYGEEISEDEFFDIVLERNYPNGLRHAADEHPNHHKSEIVDGTRISFSKRKFS